MIEIKIFSVLATGAKHKINKKRIQKKEQVELSAKTHL